MLPAPDQITHLLRRWGEGDPQALDQLMPLIYDRLRQLAHQRIRSEPGGSLNTTALVHEVYLKLADTPQTSVRDRAHFLALASRVMRHLLVDHARARKAAKRRQRKHWTSRWRLSSANYELLARGWQPNYMTSRHDAGNRRAPVDSNLCGVRRARGARRGHAS